MAAVPDGENVYDIEGTVLFRVVSQDDYRTETKRNLTPQQQQQQRQQGGVMGTASSGAATAATTTGARPSGRLLTRSKLTRSRGAASTGYASQLAAPVRLVPLGGSTAAAGAAAAAPPSSLYAATNSANHASGGAAGDGGDTMLAALLMLDELFPPVTLDDSGCELSEEDEQQQQQQQNNSNVTGSTNGASKGENSSGAGQGNIGGGGGVVFTSTLDYEKQSRSSSPRWLKVAATANTSRLDAVVLKQHLERRCAQEHARPRGTLCPIRERIYRDGLREVIRQVTLLCPERGQLLHELCDGMDQATGTYDILFDSACQYAVRKSTERDLKSHLYEKKHELESEVRRCENRVHELRAKYDGMQKRFEEHKAAVGKVHEAEINYVKVSNQQIVSEVKRIMSSMEAANNVAILAHGPETAVDAHHEPRQQQRRRSASTSSLLISGQPSSNALDNINNNTASHTERLVLNPSDVHELLSDHGLPEVETTTPAAHEQESTGNYFSPHTHAHTGPSGKPPVHTMGTEKQQTVLRTALPVRKSAPQQRPASAGPSKQSHQSSTNSLNFVFSSQLRQRQHGRIASAGSTRSNDTLPSANPVPDAATAPRSPAVYDSHTTSPLAFSSGAKHDSYGCSAGSLTSPSQHRQQQRHQQTQMAEYEPSRPQSASARALHDKIFGTRPRSMSLTNASLSTGSVHEGNQNANGGVNLSDPSSHGSSLNSIALASMAAAAVAASAAAANGGTSTNHNNGNKVEPDTDRSCNSNETLKPPPPLPSDYEKQKEGENSRCPHSEGRPPLSQSPPLRELPAGTMSAATGEDKGKGTVAATAIATGTRTVSPLQQHIRQHTNHPVGLYQNWPAVQQAARDATAAEVAVAVAAELARSSPAPSSNNASVPFLPIDQRVLPTTGALRANNISNKHSNTSSSRPTSSNLAVSGALVPVHGATTNSVVVQRQEPSSRPSSAVSSREVFISPAEGDWTIQRVRTRLYQADVLADAGRFTEAMETLMSVQMALEADATNRHGSSRPAGALLPNQRQLFVEEIGRHMQFVSERWMLQINNGARAEQPSGTSHHHYSSDGGSGNGNHSHSRSGASAELNVRTSVLSHKKHTPAKFARVEVSTNHEQGEEQYENEEHAGSEAVEETNKFDSRSGSEEGDKAAVGEELTAAGTQRDSRNQQQRNALHSISQASGKRSKEPIRRITPMMDAVSFNSSQLRELPSYCDDSTLGNLQHAPFSKQEALDAVFSPSTCNGSSTVRSTAARSASAMGFSPIAADKIRKESVSMRLMVSDSDPELLEVQMAEADVSAMAVLYPSKSNETRRYSASTASLKNGRQPPSELQEAVAGASLLSPNGGARRTSHVSVLSPANGDDVRFETATETEVASMKIAYPKSWHRSPRSRRGVGDGSQSSPASTTSRSSRGAAEVGDEGSDVHEENDTDDVTSGDGGGAADAEERLLAEEDGEAVTENEPEVHPLSTLEEFVDGTATPSKGMAATTSSVTSGASAMVTYPTNSRSSRVVVARAVSIPVPQSAPGENDETGALYGEDTEEAVGLECQGGPLALTDSQQYTAPLVEVDTQVSAEDAIEEATETDVVAMQVSYTRGHRRRRRRRAGSGSTTSGTSGTTSAATSTASSPRAKQHDEAREDAEVQEAIKKEEEQVQSPVSAAEEMHSSPTLLSSAAAVNSSHGSLKAEGEEEEDGENNEILLRTLQEDLERVAANGDAIHQRLRSASHSSSVSTSVSPSTGRPPSVPRQQSRPSSAPVNCSARRPPLSPRRSASHMGSLDASPAAASTAANTVPIADLPLTVKNSSVGSNSNRSGSECGGSRSKLIFAPTALNATEAGDNKDEGEENAEETEKKACDETAASARAHGVEQQEPQAWEETLSPTLSASTTSSADNEETEVRNKGRLSASLPEKMETEEEDQETTDIVAENATAEVPPMDAVATSTEAAHSIVLGSTSAASSIAAGKTTEHNVEVEGNLHTVDSVDPVAASAKSAEETTKVPGLLQDVVAAVDPTCQEACSFVLYRDDDSSTGALSSKVTALQEQSVTSLASHKKSKSEEAMQRSSSTAFPQMGEHITAHSVALSGGEGTEGNEGNEEEEELASVRNTALAEQSMEFLVTATADTDAVDAVEAVPQTEVNDKAQQQQQQRQPTMMHAFSSAVLGVSGASGVFSPKSAAPQEAEQPAEAESTQAEQKTPMAEDAMGAEKSASTSSLVRSVYSATEEQAPKTPASEKMTEDADTPKGTGEEEPSPTDVHLARSTVLSGGSSPAPSAKLASPGQSAQSLSVAAETSTTTVPENKKMTPTPEQPEQAAAASSSSSAENPAAPTAHHQPSLLLSNAALASAVVSPKSAKHHEPSLHSQSTTSLFSATESRGPKSTTSSNKINRKRSVVVQDSNSVVLAGPTNDAASPKSAIMTEHSAVRKHSSASTVSLITMSFSATEVITPVAKKTVLDKQEESSGEPANVEVADSVVLPSVATGNGDSPMSVSHTEDECDAAAEEEWAVEAEENEDVTVAEDLLPAEAEEHVQDSQAMVDEDAEVSQTTSTAGTEEETAVPSEIQPADELPIADASAATPSTTTEEEETTQQSQEEDKERTSDAIVVTATPISSNNGSSVEEDEEEMARVEARYQELVSICSNSIQQNQTSSRESPPAADRDSPPPTVDRTAMGEDVEQQQEEEEEEEEADTSAGNEFGEQESKESAAGAEEHEVLLPGENAQATPSTNASSLQTQSVMPTATAVDTLVPHPVVKADETTTAAAAVKAPIIISATATTLTTPTFSTLTEKERERKQGWIYSSEVLGIQLKVYDNAPTQTIECNAETGRYAFRATTLPFEGPCIAAGATTHAITDSATVATISDSNDKEEEEREVECEETAEVPETERIYGYPPSLGPSSDTYTYVHASKLIAQHLSTAEPSSSSSAATRRQPRKPMSQTGSKSKLCLRRNDPTPSKTEVQEEEEAVVAPTATTTTMTTTTKIETTLTVTSTWTRTDAEDQKAKPAQVAEKEAVQSFSDSPLKQSPQKQQQQQDVEVNKSTVNTEPEVNAEQPTDNTAAPHSAEEEQKQRAAETEKEEERSSRKYRELDPDFTPTASGFPPAYERSQLRSFRQYVTEQPQTAAHCDGTGLLAPKEWLRQRRSHKGEEQPHQQSSDPRQQSESTLGNAAANPRFCSTNSKYSFANQAKVNGYDASADEEAFIFGHPVPGTDSFNHNNSYQQQRREVTFRDSRQQTTTTTDVSGGGRIFTPCPIGRLRNELDPTRKSGVKLTGAQPSSTTAATMLPQLKSHAGVGTCSSSSLTARVLRPTSTPCHSAFLGAARKAGASAAAAAAAKAKANKEGTATTRPSSAADVL